jgi:hypothetical protein
MKLMSHLFKILAKAEAQKAKLASQGRKIKK